MKAKVIETGEIVDVKYWGSPSYAVFDGNSKIKEIYDADELEFEPGPKMVSLDKICEWLEANMHMYNTEECEGDRKAFIYDLRKEFE